MAIIVTGGAGFIGANFVLDWIETSDELVINIDKLTYAADPGSIAAIGSTSRHVFIQGDIADRALVQNLFETYKPRAILNFAAETHVDRSIEAPRAFVETNIVGAFVLLEVAHAYYMRLDPDERNAFRFLQVSTDEVFGSLGPDDPRFSESSPYAPNSPYSASKAAADHLVRSYFHTYGLPVLTTNCSNNYGPLQYPEKLIPLMISRAVRGQTIPIYGDGQNVRDWLYVRDHCEAIRTVLEHGRPGETYLVGGDSEKRNLDVALAVCNLLDELVPQPRPHAELISFVTDRLGHDRRYGIDASRMRDELGWRPREAFESGIAKTVRWYLDNSDWVSRSLERRSGIHG